jgi:hypothetical protein
MIEGASGLAQQFLQEFNLTTEDFRLENYAVLFSYDADFESPDSQIFTGPNVGLPDHRPRVQSSEDDFLSHLTPDLDIVDAKWGSDQTMNLTPDFGVSPKRSAQ